MHNADTQRTHTVIYRKVHQGAKLPRAPIEWIERHQNTVRLKTHKTALLELTTDWVKNKVKVLWFNSKYFKVGR